MITVGLDLSLTHIGYVVMKDNGVVLGSGVIKSKPSGESLLEETKRIVKISEEVVQKIDEICGDEDPKMIAIEGLAFMAQGTSLVQLAGLNYLIRVLLIQFNWPFVIVAPTSLKKFVTGSGKGDKDQMMMAVFKNFGFESMDNNECDAFGLAAVAMVAVDNPIKKLTVPQQEVIKLIKRQL
jgi:crossover junction endodeoxyribonuclease RuvC